MRPSRRLWFRHWSNLITVAEGLLKTGQDMKDASHYFIGTPSEQWECPQPSAIFIAEICGRFYRRVGLGETVKFLFINAPANYKLHM